MAWTVLGVSFLILCLLVVSVPQAVRWYLAHAMSDRPIRLEVNKGTAFWLPAGSRQEVNAVNDTLVSAGGQIRTAGDSRAFLSLFDGSNAQLWPDTTLRVVSSQSTTYGANDTSIILAQDRGHARYNVALPQTVSRHFEVQTPQANILLREGSYKVEVDDSLTVVTVSDGSATVSANNRAVEALRGEWVKVPTKGFPTKPESSIHNLIDNGDFSHGWEGWQSGNRGVEDNVVGSATIGQADNRSFVEFQRTGSDKHAETFIHRIVNQDVSDYGVLKFTLQLKISEQSLSGGGILGTEYPLITRIHYRDSAGNEQDWWHGFYIQNDDNHPTPNADAVIANQWYDWSFDLLNSSVVSPRPAEILWIEIAASGHGYKSDVANVELLAD